MTSAPPEIPAGLREWLAGKGLTARQYEAVCVFNAYLAEHGYAPRLDDIADAIGISKEATFERVDALVRKGVLGRRQYKSRGLYLLWNPDAPDPAALLSEIAALRGAITRALPLLRRYADRARTQTDQQLPLCIEKLADGLSDVMERTGGERMATV